MEQAADAIVVADPNGLAVIANEQTAVLLGKPIEQVLGHPITDHLDPDELVERPIDLSSVLEGNVVRSERWMVRGDGTRIPVEISAKVLADGRLQAIMRDTSERHVAQTALRESEERYRQLSELASDCSMAVRIDPDGRVTREFETVAFRRITGFAPDEVDAMGYVREPPGSSKEPRHLIHPEDAAALLGRLRLLTSGPWGTLEEEFRIVTKQGLDRWVRTRLRPVRFDDCVRVYAAAQDITFEKFVERERDANERRLEAVVQQRTAELEQVNDQLRNLQTRLMQARYLETAEELAGRVAHAINNPLAALIGTVQHAIERADGENAPLEAILRNARRIRDVVARTLQLFREGELDLAVESANDILDDVRDELQHRATANGVDIVQSVEKGLTKFHADRTLLVAALAAIAENSIDVMPSGGELRLRARQLEGLEVIQFTVEDRGPGIPEELREQVFQPFFTTRGNGSGLGLSIAHGVVRGHEGRIRIESRSGGGTRFVVELPRYCAGEALPSV